MKRSILLGLLSLLLFSALLRTEAVAQTTLVAGDIAFSGYISTVTPDEYSFVLLRNITAGTTINFTDNSWLNTGVFRTGEQNVTWTATTALNAGQEIRISGTTASLASGAGSPGTVTGTAINLNTSGDQILAFQGTTGSPTFISAIHMNVYTVAGGDLADTTAATWDGIASDNSNASALPPGLTTGTNAIWVGTPGVPASEFDNARFTCGSASVATVAAARAALNNPANWTKTNITPGFTLPTGCPYLVVTAANVSVGGRIVDANGNGIANARVLMTDSGGNLRTAATGPFGYYLFQDVEAGGTYTVSVSAKGRIFGQSSVLVTPSDSVGDLNFVAEPN